MSHNICKGRDRRGSVGLRRWIGAQSPASARSEARRGPCEAMTGPCISTETARAVTGRVSGLNVDYKCTVGSGCRCRVQRAPKKKNGFMGVWVKLGARVQVQGAGAGCTIPEKSKETAEKMSFFTVLFFFTAKGKIMDTFFQEPTPLHPNLFIFLKIFYFYWVQVGVKRGCRLGASWVQVPQGALTCTQKLNR